MKGERISIRLEGWLDEKGTPKGGIPNFVSVPHTRVMEGPEWLPWATSLHLLMLLWADTTSLASQHLGRGHQGPAWRPPGEKEPHSSHGLWQSGVALTPGTCTHGRTHTHALIDTACCGISRGLRWGTEAVLRMAVKRGATVKNEGDHLRLASITATQQKLSSAELC